MHDMWEQLNDPHYTASMRLSADAFDCGGDDACWGPGPPPPFRMPPPPRPPFLQELTAASAGGLKCTEDHLPDIEMCAALPAVSLYSRCSTDNIMHRKCKCKYGRL